MKPVSTTYTLPIAVDAKSTTPLYRQIYEWFRSAILGSQLLPGQVVPSTRALASQLRVSRAPVLVAFELLHAEGYLESEIGGKTRVSPKLSERHIQRIGDQSRDAATQAVGPRTVGGQPIRPIWNPGDPWWPHTGAFRVGVPDTHHFPVGVWSRLIIRHARAGRPRSMGSMGYRELRVAIAEYLRTVRDVRCTPDQVMITSGAQHGLQLAGRVLLGVGDSVWMEDPGYWGARGAFESVGANVVPVPVDGEGMDIAEGMRRDGSARAAYVTPAHQFPLGCTMSITRRMMLLDWAARNDAWIIEDDYDSEFRFSGQPISSLQSLDTEHRVIYIGTFSKVFSNGLRIGYMVIPVDLVPLFRSIRHAIDFASPTLCQLALADLLESGQFSRHIRRLNRVFAERRAELIAALAEYVGDGLEVVGTIAGLHLVGLLPSAINDDAVARHLATARISAIPLSSCYLDRAAKAGLILGYANVEANDIRRAVKTLGGVLQQDISKSKIGCG